MTQPHNDRARPATTPDGPTKSIATDTPMVATRADERPRCCHCGHVVFTTTSIRLGIGLACRRNLARIAREVAA